MLCLQQLVHDNLLFNRLQSGANDQRRRDRRCFCSVTRPRISILINCRSAEVLFESLTDPFDRNGIRNQQGTGSQCATVKAALFQSGGDRGLKVNVNTILFSELGGNSG